MAAEPFTPLTAEQLETLVAQAALSQTHNDHAASVVAWMRRTELAARTAQYWMARSIEITQTAARDVAKANRK